MNEKETKEIAERYVELLSSYENYMKALEKITNNVSAGTFKRPKRELLSQ